MQNPNNFSLRLIKTPIEPDFRVYLEDTFINKLKDLGFTLVDIASTEENDEEICFHALTLTHDGKTEFRKQWLRDICIQDDDGQPESCYTYYLGTLWIFIPYHP